jgi:hypothetical protein
MAVSYEEYLNNINVFYKSIQEASIETLSNVDWLTECISKVGLVFEDRLHPESNTPINIYGDDSKYMNIVRLTGLWQIPRQLAGYLIKIKDLDIKHFLDIGTFAGATITVITIYLLRFGIVSVQTIDLYRFIDKRLIEKWNELSLPLKFTHMASNQKFTDCMSLTKYDLIFIDANHDYEFVKDDYLRAKSISKYLTFHDINDVFCTGVSQLWNEIKNSGEYKELYEFTYHSHNLRLMGIGLISIELIDL